MIFACVVFRYLDTVALKSNLKGIFRFARWFGKAEVYDDLVAIRGTAPGGSEEPR